MSWDGSAKPSSATLAYIGKGGAFLTGATEGELTKETQACVALALKPGSMETADRSFRGVKIECQAFARDGGGGAVTVYRRFGAYPKRPDPTPETAAAAEATSRRVASEASAKAEKSQADMKAFAEWWEDSSIPKDVKVFVMMSSRVIALEERCPTARKHAAKIAAWANSAGIETDDLAPGGRYHILLAGTLGAMRKDTQKESVREACESLEEVRLSMRALAALILLSSSALAAEPITGRASVTDGDTVVIHGTRIRLHGIDVPESAQLCQGADGKDYRCGQQAALTLFRPDRRSADRVRASGYRSLWPDCRDL